MARFLAKRVGQALFSLLVLMSLVFFLFRLIPTDPTAAFVDANMSAEQVQRLRADFGLDRPLHEQYLIYMKNVVTRGDFGTSFFYKVPAWSVLGAKVLNTLLLAIAVLIVAYGIGIGLGALLAWYRGSKFETTTISVALFLQAAPEFWIGMLGVMLFSYKLGWFPHSGMREAGYEATSLLGKYLSLDFLHHLVLPALVGGLTSVATPMLLMRNSMLEVKHEDFVDLARAKGLTTRRVIYVHAARNALLPVVTAFATSVGRAIGGMVLVEYVFSWPGLGREIVLAATRFDYPVAQAAFLMIAAMVLVMNIVADVLYGYLDPRIVYK